MLLFVLVICNIMGMRLLEGDSTAVRPPILPSHYTLGKGARPRGQYL